MTLADTATGSTASGTSRPLVRKSAVPPKRPARRVNGHPTLRADRALPLRVGCIPPTGTPSDCVGEHQLLRWGTRGASMKATDLPAPACRFGYTTTQLLGVIGVYRLEDFHRWMQNRPSPLCDGRLYDDETGAMQATGCGPHGWVVPPEDLKLFLRRSRP